MTYKNLIKVLALVIADNVYGPIDKMARAIDVDMVRAAFYETLRYLSTEIRKCIDREKGQRELSEEDEKTCQLIRSELGNYTLPVEEIEAFLAEVERKGVGLAKRIAIQALTRGLNLAKKTIPRGG